MSKAFTTDINKHSHRGWDFYSKSSRILKSDGPERTVYEIYNLMYSFALYLTNNLI